MLKTQNLKPESKQRTPCLVIKESDQSTNYKNEKKILNNKCWLVSKLFHPNQCKVDLMK